MRPSRELCTAFYLSAVVEKSECLCAVSGGKGTFGEGCVAVGLSIAR